jgi:hypothetical protein
MAIFARLLRLAAAAALSVPLAHVQPLHPISIEGDVVDALTGTGIPGARVRFSLPGEDLFFVTTDAQGHFLLTGEDGLDIPLSAACPGYVEPAAAGGRSLVQEVSRSSAGVLYRLELVRQSAIVGKVIDPVGVPIAGVSVKVDSVKVMQELLHRSVLVDDDFRHFTANVQTNDLGEYRFPLQPGTYYLAAEPEVIITGSTAPPQDPSQRLTYYPHGVKASQAEPVQLAEGEERRVDIQIVREGGVKVRGRILGVQGGEGARLSMDVTPLNSGGRIWHFDNIDGRFEAPALLPGTYRFIASEGFSGEDGPVAVARRRVEVGSADLDGVDLELQPTVEITGSVAFGSGCPAAPSVGSISEQSDQYTYQIRPDAGGLFTLKHVIQGHYKTYVMAGAPAKAAAASVKFGEAAGGDGFDVSAANTGPLRITISCPGR